MDKGEQKSYTVALTYSGEVRTRVTARSQEEAVCLADEICQECPGDLRLVSFEIIKPKGEAAK